MLNNPTTTIRRAVLFISVPSSVSSTRKNKWVRHLLGAFTPPLILPLLLLATSANAQADPLDCNKFFTPASNSQFSFAWRGDRCEGFVQQKVSYKPISIKISYFGFGNLAQSGAMLITNKMSGELELHGELESMNTFYRLVARLAPGQSIKWRYPTQLKEKYGDMPERIGMLASRPGSNIYEPFTVSGSKVLYIGIVSSNFRFNAADVIIDDDKLIPVCQHTYDFHHVVIPLEQQTFPLNLCGKDLSSVRRISIGASLVLKGKKEYSSRDSIWVH